MELSVEETNFIKITKIVMEIIPKYLRMCFVKQWNRKHPKNKWSSDNASGLFLFDQLPERIQNNKSYEISLEKMKTGDENNWDTTTLVLVMLNSGLKLIKGVRPSQDKSTPLRISEEIDVIRSIRNSHFAHASSMSCSSDDFTKIMMAIKSTARNIFDKEAEDEIHGIENSQIETKMTSELRRQLYMEINRNREFDTACRDTLKAKYKKRYDQHEIHIVEKKGSIELQMKKIDDFYMKLKIGPDFPPEDTLQAETRQKAKVLKNFSVDNIEIPHLVDNEKDITFICGSPGMGKTVLVKKLACGWANGEIYTEFQWCIMFECKDINYFQATEGASLKNYELFDKFLETEFPCDFGDGKGILFIVDALDELHGINDTDSVIRELLKLITTKYSGSKVIVTGRPHVGKMLSRHCRTICGLRRVEIQGLCEEQIEEYVNKFNSHECEAVDIRKAKDSSNRYLPIAHIPQFLNTFCCVSRYLKEDSIGHIELCCWTLYLLLRQHGVCPSSTEKNISEIFEGFSKDLLTLGRICFKLTLRDKVIIEDDMKSELGNTAIEKGFFKCFFVDASDIFRKKCKLEHLSLIEFLSSLHICTCKSRKKVIEEVLRKGLIKVVLLVCQMVEANRIEGTVSGRLLKAIQFKPLDSNAFCSEVIESLHHCALDDWTKFGHSLEIIGCFLNAGGNSEKSVITSVKRLRCGDSYISNEKYNKKLSEIVEHMKSVYKLEKDAISAVFDDIGATRIAVNEYEALTCAKYLTNVDGITLKDMSTSVHAIQKEVEERVGERCTVLVIENCKLGDCDEEMSKTSCLTLELLQVEKCKMNLNSFAKVCEWGAFCKLFILTSLNIENEWWLRLVEAIEDAKKCIGRSLNLKNLNIRDCSTTLNNEMLMRIKQCEVDTQITKLETSETKVDQVSDQLTVLPRRITLPQMAMKNRYSKRSGSTSGITDSIRSSILSIRQRLGSKSKGANHQRGKIPTSRREPAPILNQTHPPLTMTSLSREISNSTPNVTYIQEEHEAIKRCDSQEAVNIRDENENYVQMVLNEFGNHIHCESLKLTLDVPPKAVDKEVPVEICSVCEEDAPMILCDFGEFIISDIIQINPMAMQFSKPALLSIKHGVKDFPELSCAAMKCFDLKKKEWMELPLAADEENQRRGVSTAEISVTSFFVVLKSLNSDFYAVPKSPSSYSPFKQNHVKLIFEENTFATKNAVIEVKMNIFLDKAIAELSKFGIKALSALVVKEKYRKQPKKSIRLLIHMNRKMQIDEKLLILHVEHQKVRDVTEISPCDLEDEFATARLDQLNSIIIVHAETPIFEHYVNHLGFETIGSLIQRFTGPTFNAHFVMCNRGSGIGRRRYCIVCYTDYKREAFDDFISDYQYQATYLALFRLYTNTEITVRLEGRYNIDNNDQEVMLRFTNYVFNYSEEFVITETPNVENCNVVIYKDREGVSLHGVKLEPN